MLPSLAPTAPGEPQSRRTDPAAALPPVAPPTPQRLIEIRRINALCARSLNPTVRTAGGALGELLHAYDSLNEEVRRLRDPAQRWLLWENEIPRPSQNLFDCPLDGRLLETLVGAARGESNAECGRRLHVSEEGMKSRRKKIMQRLAARSMPHAVAISMAHGWITADDVLYGTAPNTGQAPAVRRAQGGTR